MDSSRDCRGRIQPKQKQNQESVLPRSNQTPNPQLSAADISTRPSPNNTQSETMAQNETKKARSRRFSRGRKRPEDKSSTVGAANQTDSVNQASLNKVQGDATDETGRQNGTRKRRKRRPRTRREENVSDAIKSDENALPQNDTTGKEGGNHARIRQQEQRRLQETPEANKNIALKGIDDSLSKDGLQDDARVTMEESRVKDNGDQKQGQRGSQKQSEQKITTAKESGQKKLSQSDQLDGARGNLEEPLRQDATKKQGARGDQNKVETDKSGRMANRLGNELPQNDQPNGTTGEGGSQDNTRKRTRNRRKAKNKVLVAQDIEKEVKEGKFDTLDVNNNTSQSNMQVKTAQKKTTEKKPDQSVPGKDPSSNKTKAKKKKQKTGSQLKTQSLEAMRNLLSESPEEIVNWLISEQSSLFGKKQKRKDEVVALLVKLLAKACDCKCHSGLGNLFSVLSKSWFLTQRVGSILDQLAAKKSKKSQTKHFDLETIKDLAKVLKETLDRFPKASKQLPIVKLHSSTMKLARSGELIDREISTTVQELMKLSKKEEVTRCRQQVMHRSRPAKAGKVLRYIFFAFAG